MSQMPAFYRPAECFNTTSVQNGEIGISFKTEDIHFKFTVDQAKKLISVLKSSLSRIIKQHDQKRPTVPLSTISKLYRPAQWYAALGNDNGHIALGLRVEKIHFLLKAENVRLIIKQLTQYIEQSESQSEGSSGKPSSDVSSSSPVSE